MGIIEPELFHEPLNQKLIVRLRPLNLGDDPIENILNVFLHHFILLLVVLLNLNDRRLNFVVKLLLL